MLRGIDYSKVARVILEEITSLLIGFFVASLILYLNGYDPIWVFSIMFSEGFKNPDVLLKQSIPIIATGLAFSIPALAGLFNIGGESQLYMGAFTGLITTYVVFKATGLSILATIMGLLAGTLAGGLWGFIIGALRAYRSVNEVVVAIMMNWATYNLILYLIVSRFTDPIYSHTSVFVPLQSRVPHVLGFAIITGVALLVYFVLKYTLLGYSIRVAGLNPRAAVYTGFKLEDVFVKTMSIAGAIAGLGGAVFVLSVVYTIDTTLSTIFGLGFLGIGIGLLGRNNPIGIILAGLFISGLQFGGQWIELRTGAPPYLTEVIIGVIIVALSIPYVFELFVSRFRRRVE